VEYQKVVQEWEAAIVLEYVGELSSGALTPKKLLKTARSKKSALVAVLVFASQGEQDETLRAFSQAILHPAELPSSTKKAVLAALSFLYAKNFAKEDFRGFSGTEVEKFAFAIPLAWRVGWAKRVTPWLPRPFFRERASQEKLGRFFREWFLKNGLLRDPLSYSDLFWEWKRGHPALSETGWAFLLNGLSWGYFGVPSYFPQLFTRYRQANDVWALGRNYVHLAITAILLGTVGHQVWFHPWQFNPVNYAKFIRVAAVSSEAVKEYREKHKNKDLFNRDKFYRFKRVYYYEQEEMLAPLTSHLENPWDILPSPEEADFEEKLLSLPLSIRELYRKAAVSEWESLAVFGE
jgi:hypothetical protein